MIQSVSLSEVLVDSEIFTDGDWVESKDQDPRKIKIQEEKYDSHSWQMLAMAFGLTNQHAFYPPKELSN